MKARAPREEVPHGDLFELIARERCLLSPTDEHRSPEHVPASPFVESLQRKVAGEDAQVGARRRHHRPRRFNKTQPVALATERFVGDDGAQSARGISQTFVRDVLGKDVERREDTSSFNQEHRQWPQRGVVPGSEIAMVVAGPGAIL